MPYVLVIRISIPLHPSDRKSSKETKTQQGISTKELLIETLIREARLVSDTSPKTSSHHETEILAYFLGFT